jgi:hypothetical protein
VLLVAVYSQPYGLARSRERVFFSLSRSSSSLSPHRGEDRRGVPAAR